MNSRLVEAIRHKRILVFTYQAKDRVVEPHAYGTIHGHQEILKGYQTGGKSEGEVPGWQDFAVSEIKELKVTKDNFKDIRPGFTPKDKTFHNIFSEVEAEKAK